MDDTCDEFKDADDEFEEAEGTGVTDDDILSRADVDKDAAGADDLCVCKDGEEAVTADESDTALVSDLLLA